MGSCFTTPEQTAQQRIDKWIQQGNITRPLDLIGLNLTSIPEGILPPTLQTLLCYHNKLTSLPALPPTLQNLDCHNNQLTSLPTLPHTLQEFYYNNNPLTIQPNWPSQQQQPNPAPEPLSEEEATLCIEAAIANNDFCPILNESLQRNECAVTPCRHVFSASGLAEWCLKPNGGECPMCRQRI